MQHQVGAQRQGRCSTGVAKVLSTMVSRPLPRAMADTAWMSTSRRLGLAGVSKYTARVLGPMAAATVSGA